MAQLQAFNGGKSIRKDPHLINLNEGVVYTNIDNSKGTLTPVFAKTATATSVSEFSIFYEAQAEWVSNTTIRDYLEFQDILYIADRVGIPQKYDGTNTYNLGIAKPTTSSTVVVTDIPDSITRASLTDDTAAGNLPDSTTFTYLVVNKNTTTGFEDSGTQFTITTGVAANHQIKVTSLDTNFADEARLYRLFDGTFRLIGTFSLPTDTITDSVFDVSGNAALSLNQGNLAGTINYVVTYQNSSDGSESQPSTATTNVVIVAGKADLSAIPVSSDPQVDKKRIWRIGGGLTQYSLVATIDNATTVYTDNTADIDLAGTLLQSTNYGQSPSGLKFLTEAYAVLFGALGDKLFYTEIGLPNAWPPLNFIDFEADITGIVPVANGLLVMTTLRTHIVTGTSPNTFAPQPLSGDQGCLAFESIQKLGAVALWASNDGICASSGNNVEVITKDKLGKAKFSVVNSALHDEVYYLHQTDGTTFAIDFRYGGIFQDYNLGIDRVVVANDIIYGWKQSDGLLYTLFTSSSTETLSFTSAEIVEGQFSMFKAYKTFWVKSKGIITISILLDNVIVLTKTLSGDDIHKLTVPQDKQRAASVQFQVSGTGTLQEIEYKPLGRQNA